MPNVARDGAATIAATAVPLRSMSLDENGAAPPPELPANAPRAAGPDKNRRGRRPFRPAGGARGAWIRIA